MTAIRGKSVGNKRELYCTEIDMVSLSVLRRASASIVQKRTITDEQMAAPRNAYADTSVGHLLHLHFQFLSTLSVQRCSPRKS